MALKKVDLEKKDVVRGELPVDDRYELPDGVEWKDVCHSIVDWGMFFHANRIWVKRSLKGKKTDDEMEMYFFVEVSNFTVSIVLHMEDDERPTYLLELKNVHNKKRRVDCITDELVSVQLFKKLCQRFGNYHYTGTAGDFDKLMGYLMEHMGEGEAINELGYHQKSKSFIFCNAAVNGQVREFDKYGCFEIDGQNYYVPAGNVINAGKSHKYESAKLVRMIDNEVDFRRWAKQVHIVHREHSMMAICFGLATLFSDHIHNVEKGFPMLFMYGEPSTGKGELVRCIQTLFGWPQPAITLTGKANTDKGKMRMFAEHINLPLYLDEYRNTLPEEMFEMLKSIWDRTGYKRGNITSRYGTDTVPIRCTAFLSGNYYPNADDALLTRLIVDEMEKTQFTKEEKAEYRKLKVMIEKGYSGIIVELMKHREAFEKEYADYASKVRGDIDTLLGLRVGQDRMLKNVTILGAVYQFFEKRVQFPFTYQQMLQYMVKCTLRQEEKRDQGNDVAHFWDCFLKATKDKKLMHGEHFKIVGSELVMFWKDVHLEYQRYHYDLFRTPAQSSTGMLDKLRKNACWLGPKESVWIGEKKSSAFRFNLNAIGTDMVGLLMKRTSMEDLKEKAKAEAEDKKANKEETADVPF